MHSDLQPVFHLPLSLHEVLSTILVSTLCGTLLAVFYSQTHKGVNYSFNLVKSIVMLATITSFVMMIIGDNLARAFGMAALISLITFKSTLKGAQDFMFIYLALAIGLSAGVGLYAIALVGTLTIILITWVVIQFSAKSNQRHEYTLQIVSESAGNMESRYEAALNKFCKKYKLVESKAEVNKKEALTECAYYVMLNSKEDRESLLNELLAEDVRKIVMQFVEG